MKNTNKDTTEKEFLLSKNGIYQCLDDYFIETISFDSKGEVIRAVNKVSRQTVKERYSKEFAEGIPYLTLRPIYPTISIIKLHLINVSIVTILCPSSLWKEIALLG